MKSTGSVLMDFVIETIWFQFLCPVRNRDNLSKAIDLQATAADSTDNTSIMNDLDFDIQFYRPQI